MPLVPNKFGNLEDVALPAPLADEPPDLRGATVRAWISMAEAEISGRRCGVSSAADRADQHAQLRQAAYTPVGGAPMRAPGRGYQGPFYAILGPPGGGIPGL